MKISCYLAKCLCEELYVHLCAHTCRGQRSPQASLEWLASEHQRTVCLCILGYRMATMLHHVQLFIWTIGIELIFSWLRFKYFTDRAISSGPRQLLIFAMEILCGILILSITQIPHLLYNPWALVSRFQSLNTNRGGISFCFQDPGNSLIRKSEWKKKISISI